MSHQVEKEAGEGTRVDHSIVRPADARPSATASESDPRVPPLVRYMNATTTVERDAAFLETYAERVRNKTEVSWEIPNTRATTLEDIARRISERAASHHALLVALRQLEKKWRRYAVEADRFGESDVAPAIRECADELSAALQLAEEGR